jgi:hypothetical protein
LLVVVGEGSCGRWQWSQAKKKGKRDGRDTKLLLCPGPWRLGSLKKKKRRRKLKNRGRGSRLV